MKGFIEVSGYIINVNHITQIGKGKIRLLGIEYAIDFKESYEQIKELIKQAQ